MNIKLTLYSIFVSCIILANVTASKLTELTLPYLGEVIIPVGFIGFGLAFLCTDLINELYGKKAAEDIIIPTILSMIIGWALIYIAIWFPSSSVYPLGDEFAAVMGGSWFVVTAGIVTMAISQYIDINMFNYFRNKTNGKQKWIRNIGSTSISQFIDTFVFIMLAFVVFPSIFNGNPQAIDVALGIVVAQYVVKLVVAVIDTPLFYLGVRLFK